MSPVKNWSREDDRIYTAILKIESVEQLSLSKIDYLAQARGYLQKNLNKLPRTFSLLKHLGKA